MKKLVESFNEQLKHAVRIGEQASVTIDQNKKFDNIVIAGMGGSGIGGNLVQELVKDKLRVPLRVCKSYSIPAFINENTFFIASSFSGNTEETLGAAAQALAKGATVACVTSGGQLLELAKKHNLNYITIPGESNAPRANIGYSVVQLLFTLHKHGFIDNTFTKELQTVTARIEAEQTLIKERANEIAQSFYNRLPIIYAGGALEPVAVRFQQQLNENAKQLCHVNVFPEMNHNEIVGWRNPKNILEQATVLFLQTSLEHPRVQTRMDLCKPIFEAAGAKITELNAEGSSLLEQSFYLIHLLDWASLFLAGLNNIDPFPVEVIDHLKQSLAKA